MKLIIERSTPDKLNKEVWEFVVNTNLSFMRLVLTRYVQQERKTTRHKFQSLNSRLYEGNRPNDHRRLRREDVPLPEDVINEVRSVLKAMINSTEIS